MSDNQYFIKRGTRIGIEASSKNLKFNNMKTLLKSTRKFIALTFVIVSLSASSLFAGSGDNVIVRSDSSAKNTSSEYADAVKEMEEALATARDRESQFESAPIIKIYDKEFNLIKTFRISEDGQIEDKEALGLVRQSHILMQSDNTTHYLVN